MHRREQVVSRSWRMMVGVAGLVMAAMASAQTKQEKIEQLINMHDLKTTVAIGNYFLKQESLNAARGQLYRLGKEQKLGKDWIPENPHWKKAEGAMVSAMMREVRHNFADFEWLLPEWMDLSDKEFNDSELDVLGAHFRTEVGRKQLQITDHGVAFHVMAALTLGGRMQGMVPGAEVERREMQELYDREDREMRFDINENPESVRFAMSPVGKKYFINAVLKVTGRISQRLYQTASGMPKAAEAALPEAAQALEEFRARTPE